ncbi:MAG: 1,4-alpha-glucan branching protein domain-containing protein [Chthoniobacteraceae bacterium]
MAAPAGYLALILHAHLPYVRHPEHEEFLEEDWLYEAITETYLPLLDALHRLADDGVPFALTISLTPPLCHMLRDPLLQERYTRQLDRSLALVESELHRTRDDAALGEVVRLYHDRLTRARQAWEERWRRDLVGAFAVLEERGIIEIITCAATHGFLPLMEEFPEAVHAQIRIAREHHREIFGRDPRGIWLPECAYFCGLESFLAEEEIRWFVLDAHGLVFGTPRPQYAIYAPVFTPAGPAVFGRDRESSRQVWSAEVGYPGDPAYRDFYRDIGFDLSQEYMRPFLGPDGRQKFTGLKYHRITGRGPAAKEIYNRAWAMAAVEAHSSHFMAQRAQQIAQLRELMDVPPIIVAPFDAELFGHWWFEGVEWLELFIRKAAYDQAEFTFTTPSRYLAQNQTLQLVAPGTSSWGNHGYWEVWLDESNQWIYPHLHAAARRMTELARIYIRREKLPPLVDRALAQMARELLLAQASDWAFLMKTGTARNYATRRTKQHVLRFTRLYDQVLAEFVDEQFLEDSEWRDNIFPNLDWRVYA